MHRRLLEISEVDGNLREMARFEVDSHGLNVAEAAGGKPYGFCDSIGYGDVRRVQVDVVGDEEFSGPDDDRASRRMDSRIADIRSAIRIARKIVAEAFELAFADIFEIDAVGALG